MSVQGGNVNLNGHYQTIIPDTPHNREVFKKGASDMEKYMKGMKCINYGQCVGVTITLITTITLIGCAISDCYSNSSSSSDSTWCQTTCIDTKIPLIVATVVVGVISIGLCALGYAVKK